MREYGTFYEASAPVPPAEDGSTFSNIDVIRTTHFHLDMAIDFDLKQVRGTNTLTLKAIDRATQLILDYAGMTIQSVTDKDGNPLNYDDSYHNDTLGNAIIILFNGNIFIHYHHSCRAWTRIYSKGELCDQLTVNCYELAK